MITSNTMRFCTDIFGFTDEDEDTQAEEQEDTKVQAPTTKTAFLVSKKPFDCTKKSAVTGFIVSGLEPAKANRRLIFKIDNKLWYFVNNTLTEYTRDGNYADVIKYGNKAASLTSINSIPGFVGKKVYPIIAMNAPSNLDDMPTLKLQLKTQTTSDDLTDTQETPVYELTKDENVPRIAEISVESACSGNGTVDVKVKLQNEDESWTDYMALNDAADKDAIACQFKITYKVTTTSGADVAAIDNITIDHTLGKTVVSGDEADIYTVVADYENDLQTCYAIVRHSELIDSKVYAYVNFMSKPLSRELILIGTGTGSVQQLTLGVNGTADKGIDQSSVKLYADDDPIDEFDVNTLISQVSVKAKKNSSIFASYDYKHDAEEWLAMTLVSRQPYNDDDGTWVSRYEYTLPDNLTAGMTISNVRIKMHRTSGTVTNGSLGKATGKKQKFALAHLAKGKGMKFSDSNVSWSFNADDNIVTLVAPKNTALKITYKWSGETITVYSLSAGWSAAV